MAYTEFDVSMSILEQMTPESVKTNPQHRATFAALVQSNIEDEANATRKYMQLLAYMTDQDDIDEINEIISDELNHAERLAKIVRKYSGIKPAID